MLFQRGFFFWGFSKTLWVIFQAPFGPFSYLEPREPDRDPANFRGQSTEALISGPASSPSQWQSCLSLVLLTTRVSEGPQAVPALDWALGVLGTSQPRLPGM